MLGLREVSGLMRTALCTLFGLAAVATGVPASFAQDWRALDHGKPTAPGTEAEERQTHQRPGSNRGISLDVPIGTVSVNPEFLDGEPVYVRRTSVGEGMTVVEVSTTPFMPVLASNQQPPGVRPDQPASW
jgi:hypothetical protein